MRKRVTEYFVIECQNIVHFTDSKFTLHRAECTPRGGNSDTFKNYEDSFG